jgi:hypothetical protein
MKLDAEFLDQQLAEIRLDLIMPGAPGKMPQQISRAWTVNQARSPWETVKSRSALRQVKSSIRTVFIPRGASVSGPCVELGKTVFDRHICYQVVISTPIGELKVDYA